MVDQRSVALEEAQPAELWPPDDTEESVLGTDLHQTTITNLRVGLTELASAQTTPGQPPPWQTLGQTMIRGLQRPDGSRLTVLPDVFVYRRPVDDRRRSLALALDGPPILVIEVLSDATYKSDLDLEKGKGYSYARAGVAEYLVLDPTGEFMPEPVRGWRLWDGAYREWQPDGNGRWQSRQIGAAFAVEGARVAVYAPAGQRQFRMGEITQELDHRDQAIVRQDQELAHKDQQLAQKDRELEALRQQIERLTRQE